MMGQIKTATGLQGQGAHVTQSGGMFTIPLGGGLGGYQSGYQQQQDRIRNEEQRLRDEVAKNEFYRQMRQQMQGQIRAIQPAKKPKMTFVWGEVDD